MALPSRLTSAARSVFKASSVLSPTGIGVLLSVGAHALLFGLAPQTSFSFASLSNAAQEAKAEETIVPLTTLSPAERSRLPGFAQPRGLSTSPTGLSNLPLPSGLPFIPRANTLPKRQVPANTMPSATTKAPTTGNLGALRNTIPSSTPFRLNLPTTIPPARSPGSAPSVPVITLPTPPPANSPNSPSADSNNSGDNGGNTNGTNGNLPNLSPGAASTPGNGISIAEALAGTEAAGNGQNGGSTEPTSPTENTPEQGSGTDSGTDSGTEIAVNPDPSDGAANESSLLASNNLYDAANVSEDEAEQNLAKWLDGKGDVARGTAEMLIDSGFKACRKDPPANGRLGVIVNPDGSREGATILKSTGYDMLNRLALSTLEYQALDPAAAPIYYQVNVKVTYEPEDCVEGTAEDSSPAAVPDILPE